MDFYSPVYCHKNDDESTEDEFDNVFDVVNDRNSTLIVIYYVMLCFVFLLFN